MNAYCILRGLSFDFQQENIYFHTEAEAELWLRKGLYKKQYLEVETFQGMKAYTTSSLVKRLADEMSKIILEETKS